MKTVEKKAIDFMQEMEGNSNVTIEDHDFENIKAGLVRLLQEQARDTRHACSEAITRLEDEITADGKYFGVVSKTKAGHACMNVKTI